MNKKKKSQESYPPLFSASLVSARPARIAQGLRALVAGQYRLVINCEPMALPIRTTSRTVPGVLAHCD